MIVKNQNDILQLLKMYMDNTNISNAELSRRVEIKPPHITRMFKNEHATTINTILKCIDACDAVLDINIIPNPNKDKDNE